jgi:UDP-2-acetamido-3-amino-2,3-dideoxy-glucuronate N-acetyltransferase
MKKSLAVIGGGQWGKNIIRNLSELGLLGAICDPNGQALAQMYDVPLLELEVLLQDPTLEGVAIAVPAEMHFALAQGALLAGKHVFVEKPVTLKSSETETLWALATSQNLIFMGGHLLRYHPAYLTLESWILEGKLGDLLSLETVRNNFGRVCPGEKNVFWSLASHDISVILGLMQAVPTDLWAQANAVYTSADQGVAMLAFPSGVQARLSASWISPYKEQKCIVIGTLGTLVLEETHHDTLRMFPHILTETRIQKGIPFSVPFPQEEPLKAECLHFWNCIVTGSNPKTHGGEILGVLRVLERIDACLETPLPKYKLPMRWEY